MRKLRILWTFTIFFIMFGLGWAQHSEIDYEDTLFKMRERFAEINTYQCIFELYTAKGEKTLKWVTNYYFKKPKMIRMEIFGGDNKNATLLYDRRTHKVRARKKLFTFIWHVYGKKSFSPDHKTVNDLRGHGLHQSDWGWYIERHIQLNDFLEGSFSRETNIKGRTVLIFELISRNPEKTESISKEILWVCKKDFVPVKFVQYDNNGKKILESHFKRIKINSDLKDKVFTKF